MKKRVFKCILFAVLTYFYFSYGDPMYKFLYHLYLVYVGISLLDFTLGTVFKMKKDTTPLVVRAMKSKTGKAIGGYILAKETAKELRDIWNN